MVLRAILHFFTSISAQPIMGLPELVKKLAQLLRNRLNYYNFCAKLGLLQIKQNCYTIYRIIAIMLPCNILL